MKAAALALMILLSACACSDDDANRAADHASVVGDQARQQVIDASQEEIARHRAEAEAMDASPQRDAREALGEE